MSGSTGELRTGSWRLNSGVVRSFHDVAVCEHARAVAHGEVHLAPAELVSGFCVLASRLLGRADGLMG